MEATPKTDECIRMISEIESLNLIYATMPEPITDDLISQWGSKKSEMFKYRKQLFDNLSNKIEHYSIIQAFRLLSFSKIEYKGNSSFKQFKGTPAPDEFIDFTNKYLKGFDKSMIWQVLTEYEDVSISDLKKEFENAVPEPSKIKEYYTFFVMKYNEVLSNIPDKDYWDYFKLINDDDFMAYYNSLIKYGIVEKKEVESLILKTCIVVEFLNSNCQMIVETYKSYLPQTSKETPKETPREIPVELQTDNAKKVLQIAVRNKLLNPDYSPTEHTKTLAQKALLAEMIGEKAGIKPKWKPFEILWGVKRLSQQRYDSIEKVGKVVGEEIIIKAFE